MHVTTSTLTALGSSVGAQMCQGCHRHDQSYEHDGQLEIRIQGSSQHLCYSQHKDLHRTMLSKNQHGALHFANPRALACHMQDTVHQSFGGHYKQGADAAQTCLSLTVIATIHIHVSPFSIENRAVLYFSRILTRKTGLTQHAHSTAC